MTSDIREQMRTAAKSAGETFDAWWRGIHGTEAEPPRASLLCKCLIPYDRDNNGICQRQGCGGMVVTRADGR